MHDVPATADPWTSAKIVERRPLVSMTHTRRIAEQAEGARDATTSVSAAPSTPTRILPSWLASVERRIKDSIASADDTSIDGQTIGWTIGAQAISFFQHYADLLPGEPYLYSSLRGDLVADFHTKQGSLSLILGITSVLGFANVGEEVIPVVIDIRKTDQSRTREQLRRLTNAFRQNKHGAVDARSKQANRR